LISPNGGEIWEVGSVHMITWSSNQISENVTIELYDNNNLFAVIASSDTPNNGSDEWTIPSFSGGSNMKVRIFLTSDPSVNDESDETFTLTTDEVAQVIVTSPNGGEHWNRGTLHTITWVTNNISSNSNVAIDLYTNYGDLLINISNNEGNDGIYEWSIPTDLPTSDNMKVRIYQSSVPSVYDESDGVFKINDDPQHYLRITSPAGGETWQTGTVHGISWISGTSDNQENIALDLYKNGLFEQEIVSNIGSYDLNYNWEIQSIDTDNSHIWSIKIRSTDDSFFYNYSNPFTLE
jgi:hypothetical protein